MRKESKRDAAKEQFWRKAIARSLTSGLSKSEFCRREGLSVDVLRYWTEAIAQRDAERRVCKAGENQPAKTTFLPVVVTEQMHVERLPGTQQMAVAEIIVDGGTVRLFNGITPDTARALWLALKERAR